MAKTAQLDFIYEQSLLARVIITCRRSLQSKPVTTSKFGQHAVLVQSEKPSIREFSVYRNNFPFKITKLSKKKKEDYIPPPQFVPELVVKIVIKI